VQALGILDETDLQFLWLPMAHAFGKVLLSTQLACGFATAVDGRVERIIDNLAVVRPTFMGAAPRIFEKAYSRIVTMQASEGGLKERLFKRAFAVGLEVDRLNRDGTRVPVRLFAQHALFDRLVFAKVRQRFGGRVRFFISGAAALNQEIAEWFHAAGIVILEGYGLTETSAGSAVNHPDDYRFGCVGLVFPGTEFTIAEDGEILIRGPGVMEGYHNQPEETARALTPDGWLRTGDIGEIDDQGFVRVTDRKKDLFKTSGGKYIAPSAIESQFKAVCPYASQFLVHGSERNYVVALITLDPEAMAGWAAENQMADRTYAEVVGSPEVQEMVAGYVGTLNARLNRWESIKRWTVLDHDLTVESGELTPSLKVKRKVVETTYRDELDALYA
jgi:long-chain acyl-CoA synthetase